MKYVLQTSAGYLNRGRERSLLAEAEIFTSKRAATWARDTLVRCGGPVGSILPYQEAAALATSTAAAA
jgi:hypothetical protein